jgi:hypothetical protein
MARTREILAPNTILQNRYKVLRELGHGGMGTVYEALDQRINCLVALKETSAGNENEARRAFEREASLLGNLRHSGLPKVMDYFSEGDADFLIMEFIPGHDLANLLASRGSPFPQKQVLLWADDVLKVLEYLHSQEPPILHRDIKPANLKLTTRGEIFLLDFGLAKGTAGQMQTLATSRSVYGYTPVYASLEQILSQGTDPRSDLYSVGATLYHLLSGVVPADAPRRYGLLEDEQPDPLRPMLELNPECTASVAAIIHQSMAINRRQRPAGAIEMRQALREAAERDERDLSERELKARAEDEKKERQFAGTLQLDDSFQQEVEQVRREEAARRTEAKRQTEAQRLVATQQLAESDLRRLAEDAERAEAAKRQAEAQRLAEAERIKAARLAEEAKRQAEAAQRAEQERLRATEEARRLAEAESQRLRAEQQGLEEAQRRSRDAEAQRVRLAEQQQNVGQTFSETTVQAPAPPGGKQGTVSTASTGTAGLVARPATRNRIPLLIALVIVFAAVGGVAAVVWLYPWGGQVTGMPAGNSNNAAPPANSNTANANAVSAPTGDPNSGVGSPVNANRTAGPSRSPGITLAHPPNANTASKPSVKPENANRARTSNGNERRAVTQNTNSNSNGKRRVDDAAERRRRARSILDKP